MSMLAQLLRRHQSEFLKAYGDRMKPEHYRAMAAIQRCHSPECGVMQLACSDCLKVKEVCHSCGHRSCPDCQHGAQQQWLNRQLQKTLPVTYYMVTFTLPASLRGFAFRFQTWAYDQLFRCARETLNQFAENDPKIGSQLGMTGVLHTHTRTLDYHPHVHFIVAGGGYDARHRSWLQKRQNYLFNGKALACVFRGKFLSAMTQAGYSVPQGKQSWVAQIKAVGQGDKALAYLSRYLYRGVISDKNIVRSDDDNVTFRYQDSRTKQQTLKTEPILRFLWKVIQHVLPKGFRRARDYGFLHGNAKALRENVRQVLQGAIPQNIQTEKTKPRCSCCGGIMHVVEVFVRPPYHSPQTSS